MGPLQRPIVSQKFKKNVAHSKDQCIIYWDSGSSLSLHFVLFKAILSIYGQQNWMTSDHKPQWNLSKQTRHGIK